MLMVFLDDIDYRLTAMLWDLVLSDVVCGNRRLIRLAAALEEDNSTSGSPYSITTVILVRFFTLARLCIESERASLPMHRNAFTRVTFDVLDIPVVIDRS